MLSEKKIMQEIKAVFKLIGSIAISWCQCKGFTFGLILISCLVGDLTAIRSDKIQSKSTNTDLHVKLKICALPLHTFFLNTDTYAKFGNNPSTGSRDINKLFACWVHFYAFYVVNTRLNLKKKKLIIIYDAGGHNEALQL